MGFLIALGLLIAFSAALLHPYGRKLLLVMFLVLVGIGAVGVVYTLVFLRHQPVSAEQQRAVGP